MSFNSSMTMNPMMNPNFVQDLNFGASVPSMAAPAMTAAPVQSVAPQVPQNLLASIAPGGKFAPVAGANGQGWFSKIGGLEGLGSLAQGIGNLGQVYAAIKGIGIAKDQLALSKEAYQTNLNNQRQTYNTSLEDRIRARYAMEGRGAGDVNSYLQKHSL